MLRDLEFALEMVSINCMVAIVSHHKLPIKTVTGTRKRSSLFLDTWYIFNLFLCFFTRFKWKKNV